MVVVYTCGAECIALADAAGSCRAVIEEAYGGRQSAACGIDSNEQACKIPAQMTEGRIIASSCE